VPKSKRATQPKRVTEVDAKAGQRLRIRRTELGITQAAVAERLGVTFQQVQKYEKGANRLSVGRLQQLTDFLEIPMSYFFDDKHTGGSKKCGEKDIVRQTLATRDGNKLCSMWLKMRPPLRKKVLALVATMAE
jgi:transcriptional regulator with XRE-family HTH domain